jgi:hypothetical protein
VAPSGRIVGVAPPQRAERCKITAKLKLRKILDTTRAVSCPRLPSRHARNMRFWYLRSLAIIRDWRMCIASGN